jgi:hypothetical protein
MPFLIIISTDLNYDIVAAQIRQINKLSRQHYGRMSAYDAGGRAGIRISADTCIPLDPFLKDGDSLGQVPP